jgi:thiamine pyrophosphate-dependent acetolactate synthase large subunit-like protein
MTVKSGNRTFRRLTEFDRPINVDRQIGWGSDVAAETLSRLDIPYIALNPGASYRGFHDSLVNYLGNETPEMLMCLHEEHAVAIAQGFAKATGKPMAVALHSNVGLMHGSMGIFNAWCDRQPMLVFGATGPVDAAVRRPWIDWIHTVQDQGALIRNFIKYDDQPGSVTAIPEAIYRAYQQTATAPCGPTYVCLDAGLQEAEVTSNIPIPSPDRYRPAPPPAADRELVARAARMIREARSPVFAFGRGSVDLGAWTRRIDLVERVGARALSDLKARAVFPTDHPAHVGEAFNQITPEARQSLKDADLIVSFDWIDLGGLMAQAFGGPPPANVIHVGQDLHLHNGFGRETYQLPTIDLHLLSDPDLLVRDLLAEFTDLTPRPATVPARPRPDLPSGDGDLTLVDVAAALAHETRDDDVTLASLCRGWPHALWPFRHPLDYLGKDGGGGVGSGPGLTVGAALALQDTGRITVGVLGDGDTLFSVNALWTAARYSLPALIIVANNRSYYNDELHQQGVALTRKREVANRWIGQTVDHPAPDIAMIARGQGVEAIGPIKTAAELIGAMKTAVAAVKSGKPFLLDVHIDPSAGRTLTESMADRSLAKGH